MVVVCKELGRPVHSRIDEQEFYLAVERLKQAGVVVGMSGEVSFTDEASVFYRAGPWAADTSVEALFAFNPKRTNPDLGQGTKLHSRIMRVLNSFLATQAFNALAPDYDREVMLSSGGPMVGKTWSDIPNNNTQHMDNDHLRMALQLRLGLVAVPAGTTCQITKRGTDDEDKCLHAITMPCVHPHVCKAGLARLRPHRAVMLTLKQALRRAGAEVDLERALPYLCMVAITVESKRLFWMLLLFAQETL